MEYQRSNIKMFLSKKIFLFGNSQESFKGKKGRGGGRQGGVTVFFLTYNKRPVLYTSCY